MVVGSSRDDHLIISFGEILINLIMMVLSVSLVEAVEFKKAPRGNLTDDSIDISCLSGCSIGKLSNDAFGHMLTTILRENDVSKDGVTFIVGVCTTLAFVTLHLYDKHKFMFYHNPSIDMLLKPIEMDLNYIYIEKVFHYGYISLVTTQSGSTHLKVMKVANEVGVQHSYDPNLRLLPLWPSAADIN
ncbi:Fructokinase-2 [Dendrobium catenatum]|uniref:Fructokinase-2 n=1 Tax=Dendrobium catenatum TaxID=906689 RepID=A0A2I0WIW4_9ASPA|nr:Fructokinase-2 [Dendrobium catenatum]